MRAGQQHNTAQRSHTYMSETAARNYRQLFTRDAERRKQLRTKKSRGAAPKSAIVCLPIYVDSGVKSTNFASPSAPASGRRLPYLRSGWVCVATSQVPAESRACRLCTAAFCTDSPFSNVPLWRAPAREQEAPVREWVGAARRGVPDEPRCDVNALGSRCRFRDEEVIPEGGGAEGGGGAGFAHQKKRKEKRVVWLNHHTDRAQLSKLMYAVSHWGYLCRQWELGNGLPKDPLPYPLSERLYFLICRLLKWGCHVWLITTTHTTVGLLFTGLLSKQLCFRFLADRPNCVSPSTCLERDGNKV